MGMVKLSPDERAARDAERERRKIAERDAASEKRQATKSFGAKPTVPTILNGALSNLPFPIRPEEIRNGWNQETLAAWHLGQYQGDPWGFHREIHIRYQERVLAAEAAIAKYKLTHDPFTVQERRELAELEAALNEARTYADKAADILGAV